MLIFRSDLRLIYNWEFDFEQQKEKLNSLYFKEIHATEKIH